MSSTHEIERSQWGRYLDKLSQNERKHTVRIEVEGEDIGDEQLTRELPLVGVSLERRGRDPNMIDLVVGRERQGEIIDHRIQRANRMYAQEADDGHIQCLNIEDDEHHKTLVYFD